MSIPDLTAAQLAAELNANVTYFPFAQQPNHLTGQDNIFLFFLPKHSNASRCHQSTLMAEQKLTTESTLSPFDYTTTDASFNTSTEAGLQAWVYWHYCQKGYEYDGTYRS